jgi:hypothetical protein
MSRNLGRAHLQFVLVGAALSAMLSGVGCGSESKIMVTGVVKHPDGTVSKTPSPGYISFVPEDLYAPGAKGASGAINANTGEFALYTVKPGDGAFPGKYKVTIMLDGSYPPKPNGASSLVPPEYTSPDTTPLTAEVSSSKKYFEFEVPKRAQGGKRKN